MCAQINTGIKRKRLISSLPIIRIIQADTPTLVQTDVANFRSTVQNLTGKEIISPNPNYELNKLIGGDHDLRTHKLPTDGPNCTHKLFSALGDGGRFLHMKSTGNSDQDPKQDAACDDDTIENEWLDLFTVEEAENSKEEEADDDIIHELFSEAKFPDMFPPPPLIQIDNERMRAD